MHTRTHRQVRELRGSDAVVRAKAAVAVRELLAAPASHVQCIAAGVTPALVALLQVRRGGVFSTP